MHILYILLKYSYFWYKIGTIKLIFIYLKPDIKLSYLYFILLLKDEK